MFAGRGSKRVAQMARRHPSLGSSSIAVTAETWHRVVDHMDLPEVSPRAHRRGALWGVALVKDEEDVIEAVIRHHFAQGLDAIVVADNGSTDSTPAILRRLRHEFPLYIARDRLFAYEQAAKLSCLAHLAGAARAGWVVPFDADEFWFGAAGGRLGHTLRSTDDDVTVLSAEMHNVFPLAGLAPVIASENDTVVAARRWLRSATCPTASVEPEFTVPVRKSTFATWNSFSAFCTATFGFASSSS